MGACLIWQLQMQGGGGEEGGRKRDGDGGEKRKGREAEGGRKTGRGKGRKGERGKEGKGLSHCIDASTCCSNQSA